MKLGRNFTNTLLVEVLTEEQREKVIKGEIDLFSMNGLGILKFKENVFFQLDACKKLGLDWLELDCDVPNPYLDFSDEVCSNIKKKAEELGVSLSIHLSYSGIGKEVSCIQDYERELVVGLHKKYLDFGAKIGAKSCVLHPGVAPFYFLSPVFLEKLEESLLKTLFELVPYASERGMKFHIENNVSFDNIYYEVEDILRIIDKVRKKGLEIYFNLDIGHYFTRAEKGKEIPEDPVSVMNELSEDIVYELHLNDFVPKKVIFHPPLIETPGLLEEDVLKRYFKILKEKLKPEVVVLETAFKTKEQIKKRWDFLKEETEYIKRLMEES